jgi:hypothetical protein
MKMTGLASQIDGIQTFTDALDAVGVKAWLQGGALLGMMRDGAPIGWDNDVDFGIMDGDWSAEAANALTAAGFEFERDFSHGRYYQSRWRRAGVMYDLFHYYARGDTLYCVTWGPTGPFRNVWSAFTPTRMTLNGLNVYTPGNPVRYLEQQYGDWRVPRPDWVYWRDPLNMEAV